jgi:hypothetical protein
MKKLSLSILSLVALSILSLSSCTDDDTQNSDVTTSLSVNVVMKSSNNVVRQGETIELANDQDIIISLFRVYLSNISLTTSSGAEVELKDVALVDPSSVGDNTFTVNLKGNTFTAINFGLGVDADMNDMNPGDFAQEHPLSTYQSMYWSMLKYRFVKFEGKANSKGNLGNLDDIPIALHPGTDALYKSVQLPVDFSVATGDKAEMTLEIDMDELFSGSNGFDFETESQTHSTTSDIQIADKFMTNLAASLSAVISTQ